MSEQLDATLTLRGASRASVEPGVSLLESLGSGESVARFFVPVPDGFVNADGAFEGPAEWFYENWGCKGFDLKQDMWWEETAPGDESDQWWACWNLTTTNGVPNPILKALSLKYPDLEVGFFFEEYVGGDEMFREHEVVWENGTQTEGDG